MVVSFTYLAIYTFQVRLTSVEEVGIRVEIPHEMVPTVLFVISTYLFLRLMLDLYAEAVFHNWLKGQSLKAGWLLDFIRLAKALRNWKRPALR